jgi:hypothetical protein
VGLQITYAELRREIGRFLGYDRNPDNWDSTASTDVADILRSGMRVFYFPFAGEQHYTWSFLRKVGTVSTEAGTYAYQLSSDFEGVLEGFTYGANAAKRWVQRANEFELRALLGMEYKSGAPEYCALRAVQPSAVSTTRWEAMLYPVPDAAYTLSYRYAICPDELSATNEYHLGGAAHSECVLEACLAAAERVLRPEVGPGVHTQRFQECLQASMKIDAEMF